MCSIKMSAHRPLLKEKKKAWIHPFIWTYCNIQGAGTSFPQRFNWNDHHTLLKHIWIPSCRHIAAHHSQTVNWINFLAPLLAVLSVHFLNRCITSHLRVMLFTGSWFFYCYESATSLHLLLNRSGCLAIMIVYACSSRLTQANSSSYVLFKPSWLFT